MKTKKDNKFYINNSFNIFNSIRYEISDFILTFIKRERPVWAVVFFKCKLQGPVFDSATEKPMFHVEWGFHPVSQMVSSAMVCIGEIHKNIEICEYKMYNEYMWHHECTLQP